MKKIFRIFSLFMGILIFSFLPAILLATIPVQLFFDDTKKSVSMPLPAQEIPATEDLMREHGILSRLLSIYEKIIHELDRETFQPTLLFKAATLVNNFVHKYHEHLEEQYIFPLFEHHKKEVRLVKTLRKQHAAGREITVRIVQLSKHKQPLTFASKREIKQLLKAFIALYRPHHAREDTVLFPHVRSLLSSSSFHALSEQFENIEHTLLGAQGAAGILKKVTVLEKILGIYQLDQFTPTLVTKLTS